jgi:H+/Cl- antiporter ClcA
MPELAQPPSLPRLLGRWGFLLVACSLALGAAGAAFLWGLRTVGTTFAAHPWLLWTLPLIGAATVWAYARVGKRCAAGTATLMSEIKDPQETLPASMAPMIFGFTLCSHLGGASVGREGTALQMGGAIADQFSRLFTLSKEERRTLLLCGVSGGFAAVFGTPLAAAVFALEFVRQAELGRFALCLMTAFGADWIGQHLFGATHANYRFAEDVAFNLPDLGYAALLGLAFGLTGWLFVRAVDQGKRLLGQYERPWMPYVVIVAMSLIFAALASQHLETTGLSLGLIDSALRQATAADAFAWKFALTALCLIAGFRGGEVTPLFVIGACLGSTLAGFTSLPVAIAAALGLTTLFAAAGAVPLTGLCLALELFGPSLAPYAAACGLTAWLVARGLSKLGSGQNRLYVKSEG